MWTTVSWRAEGTPRLLNFEGNEGELKVRRKKCWPEQQGLILQHLSAGLRWRSAVARPGHVMTGCKNQGLGGSSVSFWLRHIVIITGHNWRNKEGNAIGGKMDPR